MLCPRGGVRSGGGPGKGARAWKIATPSLGGGRETKSHVWNLGRGCRPLLDACGEKAPLIILAVHVLWRIRMDALSSPESIQLRLNLRNAR